MRCRVDFVKGERERAAGAAARLAARRARRRRNGALGARVRARRRQPAAPPLPLAALRLDAQRRARLVLVLLYILHYSIVLYT